MVETVQPTEHLLSQCTECYLRGSMPILEFYRILSYSRKVGSSKGDAEHKVCPTASVMSRND